MADLTDRFAFSMNGNAGKLTRRVRERVNVRFGNEADIYVSHSLEQAANNVRRIVENKNGVFINMAGDGGLFHHYNMIEEQLQNGFAGQEHPIYGGVNLGTGNAVGNHLGYKKTFEQIDYALKTDISELPIKEIPLIEITASNDEEEHTSYFPFCGMGWDAMVLDNYNILKKGVGNLGAIGYFVAGMGTFVQVLMGKSTDIEISLPSGNLKKIVDDEVVEGSLEPGAVLLEGENINVTGVSTVPEYGSGMRAFPFSDLANENELMHLRAFTGNKVYTGARLFAHTFSIMNGTYRSDIVKDFLTDEVQFRYTGNGEGTAYQVAGESLGKFPLVTCRMSDKKLRMIDGNSLNSRSTD
jgi:diacylglycerol kinase family enzyme